MIHSMIRTATTPFLRKLVPHNVQQRSNWWFLLPIFFGVFGGLISYFAIRSDDLGKARNNLYLGIALTAAETVVHVVFLGSIVL